MRHARRFQKAPYCGGLAPKLCHAHILFDYLEVQSAELVVLPDGKVVGALFHILSFVFVSHLDPSSCDFPAICEMKRGGAVRYPSRLESLFYCGTNLESPQRQGGRKCKIFLDSSCNDNLA